MKVPLFLTLGFLAPSILASTHHTATTSSSPAPIFVLKTTHTATSVLSKALSKLGYIHQDPNTSRQSNYTSNIEANTYVEVTSDTQLLEIANLHPEAKFIIPRGSRLSASSSWWGSELMTTREASSGSGGGGSWFAQPFVSEKEEVNGILELDVLALEKGAQAENWVRLCDFLGLGYSVVERFGLWHFPQ
ncbi:hypothetical protein F4805DRAFT_446366 [Annulohypoxylon moriforme]|nr:hypothetical protein F4805DRAFT_446366 [Annulohypoxylon moriforme]